MTDTEKTALERRIDELCVEVERLHADQAHWELGNCPSCPNVADLQEAMEENAKLLEDLEFERSENGWAREFLNRMGRKCGTKDCPSLVAYVTKLEDENAKLRELAAKMAKAMRVGSEWCDHECSVVFGCDGMDECPIAKELHELGVEVPS